MSTTTWTPSTIPANDRVTTAALPGLRMFGGRRGLILGFDAEASAIGEYADELRQTLAQHLNARMHGDADVKKLAKVKAGVRHVNDQVAAVRRRLAELEEQRLEVDEETESNYGEQLAENREQTRAATEELAGLLQDQKATADMGHVLEKQVRRKAEKHVNEAATSIARSLDKFRQDDLQLLAKQAEDILTRLARLTQQIAMAQDPNEKAQTVARFLVASTHEEQPAAKAG